MTAGETFGSWRVALRVARRSARRRRLRSSLIIAMITVPVLGASLLTLVWSALQLSGTRESEYQLGQAEVSMAPRTADGTDSASLLPAGSRLIERLTGRAIVAIGDGLTVLPYTGIDAADPMTTGMFVVRGGRPAAVPGEVTVTRSLARRLRVGIGDTLIAGSPQRQLTVVGIVDLTRRLDQQALIVAPSAPLSPAPERHLLADVPAGWSPAVLDTARVNHSLGNQAPDPRQQALQAATVVLVGGFATAQVVLLVGAAFAVGARRQRRELAMMGAIGASGRQTARVVLAQGVLLGALAGAVGIAGAVIAFRVGHGLIERIANHPVRTDGLPWASLSMMEVLAIVIGAVAASAPAIMVSRQPVRLGMAVRASSRGRATRLPAVTGLVLVGLGVVGLGLHAHPSGHSMILAGAAVTVLLGVLALAPAAVGLLGRYAATLPLSVRLAVRHGARHRLRTAAAVAAVGAAVAGSVALLLVGAARSVPDGAVDLPMARPGQVLLPDGVTRLLTAGDRRDVARHLGAPEPVTLRLATMASGTAQVGAHFPGSATGPPPVNGLLALAVGGAEVIRVVTGRDATPAELEAVRGGRALVFDPTVDVGGDLRLLAADSAPPVQLPATPAATVARFDRLPVAVISGATAGRLGLGTVEHDTVFTPARPPTAAQLAAADAIVLDRQARASRPPGEPTGVTAVAEPVTSVPRDPMFYVLAAVSGLVSLVASAVAIGLAAGELRADLSTMAAVGAPPRVHRGIAAAQAGSIVGLGTLLGVAAGIAPATGYVAYSVSSEWQWPWVPLAIGVCAGPLLAVAGAALLTRTRFVLTRRYA